MRYLILSFSAAVFIVAATVSVADGILKVPSELNTPGTSKTLNLPPAANNSPVIYLGNAVDPQSGELVEGYAIIRRHEAEARSNGSKKPTIACYGYIASNAKWKNVEQWAMNGSNTRGLLPEFIFSNFSSDVVKWEDATDGIVGNAVGVNVLGDGALTMDTLVADTVTPDGANEIYFADIADANSIAVTIVWGVFGGSPSSRKIVEWDQVYDDVSFDWSVAQESNKMDFENIATHELGHSIGLADMYDTTCAQVTMYGYATEGEILKRDLASADVTGADKLY